AAPSTRSSAVCASAISVAPASAAAPSRNSYRNVRAAACTEPLASGALRRPTIIGTPSVSHRRRTCSAMSAEPSCSAWSECAAPARAFSFLFLSLRLASATFFLLFTRSLAEYSGRLNGGQEAAGVLRNELWRHLGLRSRAVQGRETVRGGAVRP